MSTVLVSAPGTTPAGGPQDPLRVGYIGLGAVARSVVRRTRACGETGIAFVGALVRDPSRARPATEVPLAVSLDELLAVRHNVVVEAGGHQALATRGPQVLRARCDLLFVSIGALAEGQLKAELRTAAEARESRTYASSGAIGALDAIAAASVGGLDPCSAQLRRR